MFAQGQMSYLLNWVLWLPRIGAGALGHSKRRHLNPGSNVGRFNDKFEWLFSEHGEQHGA